jgi:acyl-CoA dehydrogenase
MSPCTVICDGVPVTARADAPDEVTEQTLWERTALGRAAWMAGAVGAVAAMRLR